MVDYKYTFIDYQLITAFWNFLSYEEIDNLGEITTDHILYEYLKKALDKINKEFYNYEILSDIVIEVIKNTNNYSFQNDLKDTNKLTMLLLVENKENSIFLRGNAENIIEAPWHRGCLLIFPSFIPYRFSENTNIVIRINVKGSKAFG